MPVYIFSYYRLLVDDLIDTLGLKLYITYMYIHTTYIHTYIYVHYIHVYIVLTLRYQSNHQRINDNMRKCQTRRANIRV